MFDLEWDVQCPKCDYEGPAEEAFLGVLGRKVCLRCRACGWTWQEEDLENQEG